MKKIFTLLLLLAFLLGGNFSWAQVDCGQEPSMMATEEVKAAYNACITKQSSQLQENTSTTPSTIDSIATCESCKKTALINDPLLTPTQVDVQCKQTCNPNTIQDCNPACTDGQQCGCTPTGCVCASTTPGLADDQTVMGMTIGTKCLLNGQCKFNIYDALGIRTSVRNEGDPTSVGIFVQDIVLSATMFIGTIVTIAIIVSGLMRIFAGASGKDPTKAKSGLINALIGLLIVVSSYLIIRLVQYIAKGF